MLRDPHQRLISYLRLSVTDRCNLSCQYCMPPGDLAWTPQAGLMQDDEIVTLVRDVFLPLGLTKLRLTGGEPLLRRGLPALAGRLAALPGLQDLSLSTNGVFLAKLAPTLRAAGVRRLNISLDSLVPERFARITRGGELARVLAGVEAALKAGFEAVKINVVIVPGTNDDELAAFAAWTQAAPVHVRFIELMQVGDRRFFEHHGFMPVAEIQARLAQDFALEPLTTPLIGNGPAVVTRIPGAPGTLGFISPMSQTFCDACNRLRLTADGQVKACLMRPHEIDLLGGLRAGASIHELQSAVRASLEHKPPHHEWGQDLPILRTMSRVGG